MFSDIYDATRNNLLEAKGTVTREAIRMAIGQLADYRRFIDPRPSCAVLLPERPRPDLETLLSTESVAMVWPIEDGGWACSRASASTRRVGEGAILGAGRLGPPRQMRRRGVVAAVADSLAHLRRSVDHDWS
jgi:hypothetical protein